MAFHSTTSNIKTDKLKDSYRERKKIHNKRRVMEKNMATMQDDRRGGAVTGISEGDKREQMEKGQRWCSRDA